MLSAESCVGWGSQADNSDARFQDRRSTKGVEGIGLYKIFAQEEFKVRHQRNRFHKIVKILLDIDFGVAIYAVSRAAKPRAKSCTCFPWQSDGLNERERFRC